MWNFYKSNQLQCLITHWQWGNHNATNYNIAREYVYLEGIGVWYDKKDTFDRPHQFLSGK